MSEKYPTYDHLPREVSGYMDTCNWKDDFNTNYKECLRKFGKELVDSYVRIKKIVIPPQLNIFSLKELHNYEELKRNWLIERVCMPKTLMVLGGSAGTGKSWLSLLMAVSISSGMDFLGKFSVSKTGVLYIDRENAIPELQKRVNMIMKGLNYENLDIPLYFLSEQQIKLDNIQYLKNLKQFSKEKGIGLIIVDTYRRAVSFEENDANAVSLFFDDMIKPFCHETGVSFLFLHHHKKGDAQELEKLRGSSDLANNLDSAFSLSKKGDTLIIKQTKARNSRELEPFSVQMVTDEDTYMQLNFMGEPRPTDKASQAAEIILVWIAKHKITSFKTKDAQEVAFKHGVKKQNFFNALTQLEENGTLIKDAKGSYNVKIQKQIDDFGLSPSPILKSIGLLDKLKSNKSNKSSSPIGQVGLEDFNPQEVQDED